MIGPPSGCTTSTDNGSVSVMTIGFLVVIGLLATVVVNASGAFLAKQRLNHLADGAAIAAADGLDENGFYSGNDVLLAPPAARRLAAEYLAGEPIRIVAVTADAESVTVRLARDVDMALTPPGWAGETTVVAVATAELRPTG